MTMGKYVCLVSGTIPVKVTAVQVSHMAVSLSGMCACNRCSLQAGARHPAHKGLCGLAQAAQQACHRPPDLCCAGLQDNVRVQQLERDLQSTPLSFIYLVADLVQHYWTDKCECTILRSRKRNHQLCHLTLNVTLGRQRDSLREKSKKT